MTSGQILRRVALLLLILVVGLAVLTARAVTAGTAAMAASDEAFHRGDVREALEHAHAAAVHYAPGAPHVARAYTRMIAVAHGAEREGKVHLAEQAWASVRGASLETRHIASPMPDALAMANASLERLSRRGSESDSAASGASDSRLPAVNSAKPGAAAPAWGILLFTGFGAMIIGLMLCVLRGVRPDGKLSNPDLRWGLGVLVFGATCWTAVVLWA